MKTYSFKVVLEPDDDRWHSYCPALEQYGASTWGATEEEAFRHIHEVVGMIIRELPRTALPSQRARAKTSKCYRTHGSQ
jgi:predicted RNase H-like HicB family nuclease